MDNIRIAVVDDHDLFREGITLVLNQINGLRVVFDTSDGHSFIDILNQIPVDIALMDIEMPGINGIQTTKRALEVKPDLRIIALTMFSDTGHYSQMIQCGAKGFILKKANKFELQQAITTVYQGGSFFSQDILQKLAFQYSDKTLDDSHLTSREIDVMLLICEGLSSQEISEKLHISCRTVEKHRASLLIKTNVKNSAGLIIWAIKNQYFSIR